MGGFEGGDEGGFWDVDAIADLVNHHKKSKPKARQKDYIETSELGLSIHVYPEANSLLTTLRFEPCICEQFTLEGNDLMPIDSTILHQAYEQLIDYTQDLDIEDFFHEHKVVLTRHLSAAKDFALSSWEAAAFILLAKETCNLVLNSEELDAIAQILGDDIAPCIHHICAE